MSIAVAALPGMRLLNSLDRYLVQSSVRTLANLSRPNRIGATVNAIRSRTNACVDGSSRRSVERGIVVGRSVCAAVLMGPPRYERSQVCCHCRERAPARGPYVVTSAVRRQQGRERAGQSL